MTFVIVAGVAEVSADVESSKKQKLDDATAKAAETAAKKKQQEEDDAAKRAELLLRLRKSWHRSCRERSLGRTSMS